MGNLAHYTNKKKLIVTKMVDEPLELTFNEVYLKFKKDINQIAYHYYGLLSNNPMYSIEDLQVAATEGMFKAYNEYQYDFNGIRRPFALFSIHYMRNEIRKMLQANIALRRRSEQEKLWIEETVIEIVDDEYSEFEVFDCIKTEFQGDKNLDIYLCICKSIMKYGYIDFDGISATMKISQQAISYHWKKFKKAFITKHIDELLC